MFEYDQSIVDQLLEGDEDFKELFQKHRELKERVKDAELGVNPMNDLALTKVKKAKLLAKDQMAGMIEEFRQQQSV